MTFGLMSQCEVQRGWTVLNPAHVTGCAGLMSASASAAAIRRGFGTFISLCYTLDADPTEVLREVLQTRTLQDAGVDLAQGCSGDASEAVPATRR